MAFDEIVHDLRKDTASLVRELTDGVSPHVFIGKFHDLLTRAHVAAHEDGQSTWGVPSQTQSEARANQAVSLGRTVTHPRTRAVLFMPGEDFYLAGFLADLSASDPRYYSDGGLRSDQVSRRAAMYEARVRATQAWGVLDGSPHQTLWAWRLGGAEEHCDDCPFLASLDPAPAADWFAVPGEGMTICVTGCNCFMEEQSTGVLSARAVE